MNFFSIQNIWSYLVAISIANKKNKKNNILLIHKSKFSLEMLEILKKYSKNYFFKIIIFEKPFKIDFSMNYYMFHIDYHNKILNNNYNKSLIKLNFLKKLNINTFYFSGDPLDLFLIKKLNLNGNFFFLEHGIGNYVSFINKGLKSFIENIIYEVFIYFKIFKIKKINFLKYYGNFSKLESIKINNREVKQIKTIEFQSELKKFSDFIFNIKNNKIIKNLLNTKYVFVSIPNYISKSGLEDYLDKCLSCIDKNEIVLIKPHPHNEIKFNINILKKKLSSKGIKFYEIKNKFLKKLNIEILSERIKIVKFITGISSGTFLYSIYKKKAQLIIILTRNNYFKKKFLNFSEIKNKSINFYKKKFNDIKFI